MLTNYRALSFLGFLGCAGAIAFALYLQHFKGYEPCPMCIFQRVAIMAAGLAFLAGAAHGPMGFGRWVYALLADLAAMAGAGIAARHVWLQSLPPDQVPACGPTLDFLREMFPLSKVVTMVLKGDGNCAKIDAAFLGLSLPFWTMLVFVAMSIYAVLTPILSRRTPSQPTPWLLLLVLGAAVAALGLFLAESTLTAGPAMAPLGDPAAPAATPPGQLAAFVGVGLFAMGAAWGLIVRHRNT